MGIGGRFDSRLETHHARLTIAYTGTTAFTTTAWSTIRARSWVLDIINHGQQPQRVGRGREFTRLSNVAALYEPGVEYHEYRQAGGRIEESYILFELDGRLGKEFRALTRPAKYCHIQDPDQIIGDRLRRLGELLFERRPRYEWVAQGIFVELLGLILQSKPLEPTLRVVRVERKTKGSDLVGTVEQYIRVHVSEPIFIQQLARQVKMSETKFAHAYPALAGESPYQTVLRLKVEEAKRLLLQEQLSVKEAANRLGFSSEFHFSRVFKQLEGVAPSAYQRALTKEQ